MTERSADIPYRSAASILAGVFISLSGPLFFVLKELGFGYGFLLLGLVVSFLSNRKLFYNLLLLAASLTIMSLVPINTDISGTHMLVMGAAMAVIVALPYLVSRYIYKEHLIHFPWHFRETWTWPKGLYIGLVAIIGYLALPFYMISTGAYENWPAAHSAGEVIGLFIGTNALGIWDELFFVCTVFVIFYRYYPFWIANILQAVLFSSFLFELGFESWGLAMTFCFALVQAYIFRVTKSLFYIVCVHLLFDLFLFMVLIHAHNRSVFDIFFY